VLLVDVVNPFDFAGGPAFARTATRTARVIDRLRHRADAAGVPVIYVNDNLGQWRSDISALVARCTQSGTPGADISARLAPRRHDFVVLKSTLSGFYQTPLETLLRLGGVRTLVLAGFAADNCVLFTAADAYMRGFRLVVPRDGVRAQSPAATRRALATMRQLFAADTPGASTLRLAARS